MSKPPSFDEEAPRIIVNQPSNSKPKVEEDEVVCDICDQTFKNTAGLGSHMTHKHPDGDINLTDEISEVYEGDVAIILIPASNVYHYDRQKMIWVNSVKTNIPSGFVIADIMKFDKVHRATDRVKDPRSFMQLLLIRETLLK